MSLVNIEVIEGVFDDDTKAKIIRDVTNTMVAIEGETMRGITWVRIIELNSGDWGIGGKGLTASDVQTLVKGVAA